MVGPALVAGDPVAARVPGGEQHNAAAHTLAAQLGHQFQALAIGQGPVDDQDVVAAPGHVLPKLTNTSSLIHDMPCRAQKVPDLFAQLTFVVKQQDVGHLLILERFGPQF